MFSTYFGARKVAVLVRCGADVSAPAKARTGAGRPWAFFKSSCSGWKRGV